MSTPRIAVLDPNDHVLGFLDNTIQRGAHVYDTSFHLYLAGSAYTLSFKVLAREDPNEILKAGNRLSFKYGIDSYYLNIVKVERDEWEIQVEAYGLSFELLNEEVDKYESPEAKSFEDYFNQWKAEARCRITINEVAEKRIKLSWDGRDTILKRLFSLATKFDAELAFKAKLNNNYGLEEIELEVRRKIGEDKTREILHYGTGVHGVKKEVDISDIYTAIKPIGKDGLTLDGYNHDPEDDGCFVDGSLIRSPRQRDLFPSVNEYGGDGFILRYWDCDVEDQGILYGRALAELRKNSVPKASYEVSGPLVIGIGDTVRIMDDQYSPPLILDARAVEVEICFEDLAKCKTSFDNFTELESMISQDIMEVVNRLVIEKQDRLKTEILEDYAVLVEDVDQVKTNLNNWKTDVTDDIDEIRQAANAAQAAANQAASTATAATTLANEAKQALKDAQNAITGVQNELGPIKQGIKDAQDAAEDAKKEVKKQTDQVLLDIAGTYETKNEVSKIKGDLQAQITANAGEIASKVSNTTYQTMTQQTQAKLDSLEGNLNTHTSKLTALETAQANAKKDLDKAQADLQQAQKDLDDLVASGNATADDLAQAKVTLNAAKTKADQAAADVAKAQTDITQAKADIQKAKTDLTALTNRVTTTETKITQNENAISLRATKEELAAMKTAVKSEIKVETDKISSQVQSITTRTGNLESGLDETKKNLEASKAIYIDIIETPSDDSTLFEATVFRDGKVLSDLQVSSLGALNWYSGDKKIGSGKSITRSGYESETLQCRLETGGEEVD